MKNNNLTLNTFVSLFKITKESKNHIYILSFLYNKKIRIYYSFLFLSFFSVDSNSFIFNSI